MKQLTLILLAFVEGALGSLAKAEANGPVFIATQEK
jgi:hypothetical protein